MELADLYDFLYVIQTEGGALDLEGRPVGVECVLDHRTLEHSDGRVAAVVANELQKRIRFAKEILVHNKGILMYRYVGVGVCVCMCVCGNEDTWLTFLSKPCPANLKSYTFSLPVISSATICVH